MIAVDRLRAGVHAIGRLLTPFCDWRMAGFWHQYAGAVEIERAIQ